MKRSILIIIIIPLLVIGLSVLASCKQQVQAENSDVIINDENIIENNKEGLTEIAVFGGGCFWSIEEIFSQLKGIIDVEAGYAGGEVENPTYEEVYTGVSGHAEVVKITFDPEIISYGQLLDIFFFVHDPTTLNKQGNDIGESYRSIILFTGPGQKKSAEDFIRVLEEEKIYADPIVTVVEPLDVFYEAESYHQEYYKNNTLQPYCQVIILPKIEKYQEKFGDLLKEVD